MIRRPLPHKDKPFYLYSWYSLAPSPNIFVDGFMKQRLEALCKRQSTIWKHNSPCHL